MKVVRFVTVIRSIRCYGFIVLTRAFSFIRIICNSNIRVITGIGIIGAFWVIRVIRVMSVIRIIKIIGVIRAI